jgi:hypothetical protein
MRSAFVLLLLLGCKGGAERAKEDLAREERDLTARQAEYAQKMAPLRAISATYEKTAREVIAAHPAADGGDIAQVKGRTLAPILATKTYPDGEKRPAYSLWNVGSDLEKQTWLAKDPATAGVLVIADASIEPYGKWIRAQGKANEKELGNAFIHRYDVRAVLVPENVVVARWTRYGQVPGISDHQLMPTYDEEERADLDALLAGTAPQADGRPPKTRLGGY